MICVPKTTYNTGSPRIKIAFSSDGGFESTTDFSWAEHNIAMSRLMTFLDDSHSIGRFVTAGDNACQGAGVNGGYTGQCGDIIGPVSRIQAVMGNHDSSDMGGTTGFMNYFGYSAPSHSWTYGNIAGWGCMSFNDAGTDLGVGSAQRDWLSRSIADSYSNPNIKWRIAHFHTPVQANTTNHPPNAAAQSVPWEDWGIDVLLHGHNHTIERHETGSVVVILCGGISNQKSPNYPLTALGAYHKWHWTHPGYTFAKEYYALLMEAEGDTLTMTFYDASGSKLPDTGSTTIPGAQMVDYSLVLTKETGGDPTGSQGVPSTSSVFTVIGNRFVESGSWTLNDNGGGLSSSTINADFDLVPNNATWNVYQAPWGPPSVYASNSGSDWASSSYDDSGWSQSLQSVLINPQNTKTLASGWTKGFQGLMSPTLSQSFTHYFRKSFNLSDPNRYNFTMSYVCDDGIAIWINEQLIETKFMPVTWSWNTSASVNVDYTSSFSSYLPRNYFRAGNNIIACEVHQSNISSTDVGFGFHLYSSGSATITGGDNPTSNYETGSILIGRVSDWLYWDRSGDPSSGSNAFISQSFYDNGSASLWQTGTSCFWITSSLTEANASYPMGTKLNYTANVGPFTFLFKKNFDVPDVYSQSVNNTFTVEGIFDDGVQFFVNGNYVGNIAATGSWQKYHQFATTVFSTEDQVRSLSISASYVTTGSNLIVAKVLQANSSSSDVLFAARVLWTGSISASATPEIAATGSKLKFYPFGTTTLEVGKFKEVNMALTSSETGTVRAARLTAYGHFCADEFSEIPFYDDLIHRADAADIYCTASNDAWKNSIASASNWSRVNTTYTLDSGSYKFTNATSYTDVASADYMTLTSYDQAIKINNGGSWTTELVFKLHNTCSLTRGYLLGRLSGSAILPDRRATGFFTDANNVLKYTYFHHVQGGTTWVEETASLGIINQNEWYHAAATYETGSEGTSSFKLYLNGIRKTNTEFITSSYDIREGTTVYVGGAPAISNSVALDQASNAYVAVTAFYNKALTHSDIRSCALYYNKEHTLTL